MTMAPPFCARVGETLILLGDTSMQQFAAILYTGGKRTERGWEWPWRMAEVLRKTEPALQPLIDEAFPPEAPAPDTDGLDKPLPDGKILRKHQVEAIRRIVHAKRIILADAMGLGKTLSALVSAKILAKQTGASIWILSPTSMADEWRSTADMMGVPVAVLSWARIPAPTNDRFILIADECHMAQGGTTTKRGKAFKVLTESKNCVSTILLTGTPMNNAQPRNIYPLLRAVKAPVAAKKEYFDRRYCDAKATKWCRWDTTGASNIEELRELSAPYIIRRTKRQCLDLPKFTRIMVNAEVDTGEQRSYRAALGHIKHKWEQSNKDPLESRRALDSANKAASLRKVPHAIAMAKELIGNGNKAVVFSQFLEPVYMVAKEFGSSALVLTGDTPPHQRKPLVDRFQSDDSIKLWCMSKAGGLGLTLTAANYIILIDRPWTPGDVNQIESRIDRMGQTQPCTAYWLRFGPVDAMRDDKLAIKALTIKDTLGDADASIEAIPDYEEVNFGLLAQQLFNGL